MILEVYAGPENLLVGKAKLFPTSRGIYEICKFQIFEQKDFSGNHNREFLRALTESQIQLKGEYVQVPGNVGTSYSAKSWNQSELFPFYEGG